MNNTISVIILGCYTIVYVIVFFIQKSHLDKIKEINTSMKSYLEIFKIDEVKKYVELKSENSLMEATNLVLDNEKVKGMVEEILNNHVKDISDVYCKQLREEQIEIVRIAIEMIRIQPANNRIEFIEKNFPLTKRYLLEMVDDINKGEI